MQCGTNHCQNLPAERRCFSGQQFQSRWEKASKKLEEANERFEALEAEISRGYKLQEEVEEQEKKEQQKIRELQELKENCRIRTGKLGSRYQEELARLEELKQQEVQQEARGEELQLQTERYKKEINHLQENILPNLHDMLEQSQSELEKMQLEKQELVDKIGEQQNQVKLIRREIEDRQASLDTEKETLETGKRQLSEQQKQLGLILEEETKTAADLADVKTEINQIEKNIRELEQTSDQYRAGILPVLQNKLQEQIEERKRQEQQRKELDERIAEMKTGGRKLLADYEARKAALEQEHGGYMAAEQQMEKLLVRQKMQQEEELKRKRLEREAAEASGREKQMELQKAAAENKVVSEKVSQLDQRVVKLMQELDTRKREYQRLQEDQMKIRDEIRNMEERYRAPLQEVQKRKALLDGLWSGLENDPVFKNDWNGSDAGAECDCMYKAVERRKMQAQQEVDNFREAYSMLVRFLEQGGF